MEQNSTIKYSRSLSWRNKIRAFFLQLYQPTRGLSVFFASLCVIDLFGVFPIVALPGALISCGYYGIPLLIFVLTIQIYTAIVLGRCWIIAEKLQPDIVDKKRCPYSAVAELIYGKRMRIFVNFLLSITVFGAGVPNILVASQNLQLIGQRISNDRFDFSFCYWLIVLGIILCPIMWLGSPKNMKTIASVSVVTVLLTSVFIWVNILEDDSILTEPFRGLRLDEPDYITMLKVYGIIVFQFDIHPVLMTIEVDMQKKHEISNAVCYGLAGKYVQKFRQRIHTLNGALEIFQLFFVHFCYTDRHSTSATCTLSVVTTILIAYQYGMSAAANVLEILPRSNLLYLAILLVTIQLCLSQAVSSSALFQNIEEYFHVPKYFNIKRCILRSIIIALTVTIAELLPQFDLVMGIIGGTLTGPMIFILPPLFYRKLIRMERDFDERNERFDSATDSASLTTTMNISDDDENILNTHNYQCTTTDNYGTFIKHSKRLAAQSNWPFCLCNDSILCISVVIFGLVVTVTSTYFNLMTAPNFDEFHSPCINILSIIW